MRLERSEDPESLKIHDLSTDLSESTISLQIFWDPWSPQGEDAEIAGPRIFRERHLFREIMLYRSQTLQNPLSPRILAMALWPTGPLRVGQTDWA
jgi:hypothetical protein